MLEQVDQKESRARGWTCQGVSPMDDPCEAAASYHCEVCGKWFCASHAEDEAWHVCALEPGDEGGEG